MSRLIVAALILGTVAGIQSARSQDLVLQGVTLVEGGQPPRSGYSVRITGGRIAEVATSVRRTRGAVVVDGRAKFVIPGLWDVHVHQALPIWRGLGADSSDAYFHPLFLASGVTAVRDMGGELATLARWRSEVLTGARLAPVQFVTGEKLGERPVVPGAPFPVTSSADVERSIELAAGGGADFIKVMELTPQRMQDVAGGAQRAGLPWAGHVPPQVGLHDMIAARVRSVEHLGDVLLSTSSDERALRERLVHPGPPPLYERIWRRVLNQPRPDVETLAAETHDAVRLERIADELSKSGTAVVPTLRLHAVRLRQGLHGAALPGDSLLIRRSDAASGGYASAPLGDSTPQALVWRRLCGVVGTFARRGVDVLAGTDAPSLYAVPGLSLHDELELLVGCGMSPAQVLKAATAGAARLAGMERTTGTIAPGMRADLVVLDADPSADIRATRRIWAVVSGGRLLRRATLDSLSASAARVVERRRPLFPVK